MADLLAMLVEDAEKEIGTKIAKKMLKRGMSAEAVAEDTSLDEAIIKQLQIEISKE